MLFWVVLALMTGAAVLTVLWPLSGAARARANEPDDVAFYRRQLDEIARDEATGLLAPAEAASARIESGRRLIRAGERGGDTRVSMGEPALRRRRAAAALALSVVPLVGLTLYGALGSPTLLSAPAQPARDPAAMDVGSALSRIEEHLARVPDDQRGWTLVAPIYLRLGRFADAARAYAAAIRLGAEGEDELGGYGEALVSAGGGVVSAEARGIFERVLALRPGAPKAAFYLALSAEQDGDPARARAGYAAIVAAAPPDAVYLPVVRARLAALDGTQAPAAPLAAGAVSPEIAAMVDGLDRRLKAGGGSEDEWSRLIRSLVVLGRMDDARDRLVQARATFVQDKAATDRLDALARALGVRVATATVTGEARR